MSKTVISVLSAIGIFIIITIVFISMFFSYNNREAILRNLITAKQKDNQSQFDNTYKTISQTSQVTKEQWRVMKDIIVGNSQARTRGGGTLATMVTEAVPNVDSSTATQLINIITAARNTWTENQRELLDYKREHDNLIDTWPSHFFVVSIGGKSKIDVTIIISDRTDAAFKSGQDNSTDVFK